MYTPRARQHGRLRAFGPSAGVLILPACPPACRSFSPIFLAGLSNSSNQRRAPRKTGNLKKSNGDNLNIIINDLLGSYYFSIVFKSYSFTVCLLFLGSAGVRSGRGAIISLRKSNCVQQPHPRTQLPPPLLLLLLGPSPANISQNQPAQPPLRIEYRSSHPLLSVPGTRQASCSSIQQQ